MRTVSDLPAACREYESVQAVLQRRSTVSDPYAGMASGSATAARREHAAGREHHAKVQRRMTTGATVGTRRFCKLEK